MWEAEARLQETVLRTTWEMARDVWQWKLAGGTALTRFHGFSHRFSEDLDFFFDLPGSEVRHVVRQWTKAMIEAGFLVDALVSDERLQRVVVQNGSDPNSPRLIVDFVCDPFPGLYPTELRPDVDGVKFRVDGVVAIAIKKLFAFHSCLSQRMPLRTKDVLDLFALSDRVDLVTLFRTYNSLFPDWNVQGMMTSVMRYAQEMDCSDIKGLAVDPREVADWYATELLEKVIAAVHGDKAERDVKGELFRIRYPGV